MNEKEKSQPDFLDFFFRFFVQFISNPANEKQTPEKKLKIEFIFIIEFHYIFFIIEMMIMMCVCVRLSSFFLYQKSHCPVFCSF